MILIVKCPQIGSGLDLKTQKEKYRQNMLADRMCLKLKYTQWELSDYVGCRTLWEDFAFPILELTKSKNHRNNSIILLCDFTLNFSKDCKALCMNPYACVGMGTHVINSHVTFHTSSQDLGKSSMLPTMSVPQLLIWENLLANITRKDALTRFTWHRYKIRIRYKVENTIQALEH